MNIWIYPNTDCVCVALNHLLKRVSFNIISISLTNWTQVSLLSVSVQIFWLHLMQPSYFRTLTPVFLCISTYAALMFADNLVPDRISFPRSPCNSSSKALNCLSLNLFRYWKTNWENTYCQKGIEFVVETLTQRTWNIRNVVEISAVPVCHFWLRLVFALLFCW